MVADPRDERVPGGERAVEGRARPGGRRGARRRAGGAAHRHDPGLARAAVDVPDDLVAHRPHRLDHRRARPVVGRLGWIPRWGNGDEGRPAVPAQVNERLHRQPLPPVGHARRGHRRGARGGARRRRRHDGQRRLRCGHERVGARPGGGTRRRLRDGRPASARGDPRRRLDRRAARRPAVHRRRRVRPGLLLRPLPSRRAAHRVRRADRHRQRTQAAAGDPHPRLVGRHVRRPRRRGRARAHRVPLLHRRSGRAAPVRRPSARSSASAASSRSRRPTICVLRRGCVPPIECSPRPTVRTSRPCRIEAGRTSRRTSPRSSPASPRCAPRTSTRCAR